MRVATCALARRWHEVNALNNCSMQLFLSSFVALSPCSQKSAVFSSTRGIIVCNAKLTISALRELSCFELGSVNTSKAQCPCIMQPVQEMHGLMNWLKDLEFKPSAFGNANLLWSIVSNTQVTVRRPVARLCNLDSWRFCQ